MDSPVALAVLMLIDGVAFGMYLTAANPSSRRMRPTWIGARPWASTYNTAGSIGGTIGPFALGILAGWSAWLPSA
ncbi:MAG: hypothetical protein R3A10_22480 [Caldilineaceae bacterium]